MFSMLTKFTKPYNPFDKDIAKWQAIPTVLFLTYCMAPGEVYAVLHFLTGKYNLLTWTTAEYIQLFQVLSSCWLWFQTLYSVTPLPNHKLIYLFRTVIVTMTTAIFIAVNREHLYAGWHVFLTRNIAVCQSSSWIITFITLYVYVTTLCFPFILVFLVTRFRLQSSAKKAQYIRDETVD